MCAWRVVVLVARPSSEGSAVRRRREVDWTVALAKGAVTGEGDSRDWLWLTCMYSEVL